MELFENLDNKEFQITLRVVAATLVLPLKTILGHANIMNTLVYLKYSNRDIQESIQKSNLALGIR